MPGAEQPGGAGGAAEHPVAYLSVAGPGESPTEYPLTVRIVVGRGAQCDLVLHSDHVSRVHAEIVPGAAGWLIRDLRSSNGTFVNGRRVTETALQHHDEIVLGDCTLRFALGEPAPAPAAEESVVLRGGRGYERHLQVRPDAASLSQALLSGDAIRVGRGLERYRALQEITRTLVELRDRAALYPLILDQLLAVVPAERATLLGAGPEGTLVPEVARNRLDYRGPVDVSRTIVDDVVEARLATLCDDAMSEAEYGDSQSIFQQNIRSVLCVPIEFHDELLGVLYLDSSQRRGAFTEEDLQFVASVGDVAALAINNARALEEVRAAGEKLNRSYLSMLAVLANAIEARDHYTIGHTWRVTRFGQLVAERLGWSEDMLAAMEVGGVLHDIGKIGVPDAILRKPGPLNDEEYARMKLHPEIGARMLEDVPELERVLPYVLCHQERWDGSGYPAGLAGEEIPVQARVLAVGDALDAMTSSRPYRRGMAPSIAIAELRRQGGKQFDPDAVQALCALYDEGKLDPYFQAGRREPGDVICPFCSTYFRPGDDEVRRVELDCPTCGRKLLLRRADDRVYAELA